MDTDKSLKKSVKIRVDPCPGVLITVRSQPDQYKIDVPVTVTVTYTSALPGDEVVIVYLHDEAASVTRPVKEVVAFRRLTLAPGEAQTLTRHEQGRLCPGYRAPG